MRTRLLGGTRLRLALLLGLFVMVAGAGGGAAAESDTVGSFWRGMWWSVSLIMTEGFIGAPPRTTLGAVISVLLMITGFAMLSVVSAALASIFVRDDEREHDEQEAVGDAELLEAMRLLLTRMEAIEERLDAKDRDRA